MTDHNQLLDRRSLLRHALFGGGTMLLGGTGGVARLMAADAGPRLVRFPEKTDLILLTDRPPNLETPIRYFREDFTPNEAFFVRWHLGITPTSVDTKTWRLDIGGNVNTPLSLSLDDLKSQYEAVSVAAVNQCSGNGRGLFTPRVTGGQWGNGAMGNALWKGVRLADVLKKAGVKAGSVDVTFGGMDRSPMPTVAPFVKSIPVDHPKLQEVILAYEMNGKPLPMLNGFPLRAVVPGWYATYWVKSLNAIKVTTEKFAGFWMAKAYKTPATANMCELPDKLAQDTVPIGEMTCRSILVRPESGDRLPAGKPVEIDGLAIDSGKGITKAEISTDGGKTWQPAKLDAELGKYAWRRFRLTWTPTPGQYQLQARVWNAAGETQTTEQWNRAGYGRNLIETVTVTAV